MFDIGTREMALIELLCLVIFDPGWFAKTARDFGQPPIRFAPLRMN